MKKLLNIFAILLMVVACNEEQPAKREESLIDTFLKGESFLQLKISLPELDLSKAIIRDMHPNTKSILIPFKGKLKYLISEGVLRSNVFEFSEAFKFEYITELSYEQVSKSLEEGRYTGELKIESNNNDLYIISMFDGKGFGSSSRTSVAVTGGCRGTAGSDEWAQDVAHCAAKRIDKMNWFDWTLCVAELPICWAQNLVSCVIDGCDRVLVE